MLNLSFSYSALPPSPFSLLKDSSLATSFQQQYSSPPSPHQAHTFCPKKFSNQYLHSSSQSSSFKPGSFLNVFTKENMSSQCNMIMTPQQHTSLTPPLEISPSSRHAFTKWRSQSCAEILNDAPMLKWSHSTKPLSPQCWKEISAPLNFLQEHHSPTLPRDHLFATLSFMKNLKLALYKELQTTTCATTLNTTLTLILPR